MVVSIFIFYLYILRGNDTIVESYFSDGLKPPTNSRHSVSWRLCEVTSTSFCSFGGSVDFCGFGDRWRYLKSSFSSESKYPKFQAARPPTAHHGWQQPCLQTSDLITPKGSFRTKGSSGNISTIRVWELTSFAYMKCDTVKQIIWMKPLYKVRTASIISTNLTKVNVIILLGGGFKHLFFKFHPPKKLEDSHFDEVAFFRLVQPP